VIAPAIDDHVRLRRHVAVDALRAGAVGPVMVMLGHVEFRGQVALSAERVALGAQRQAVRVVTVRACDAGVLHAALNKGAVFEHLAVDLAVGMVETRLKQCRQV
jgi:hypothetical protein